MVEKKRQETSAESSKIKVDKLKLDKETVTDLTSSEAKKIKGGTGPSAICPPPTGPNCGGQRV